MKSDMRTTAIYTTAALILASFIGISCQKEMPTPAEETPVTVIGTINDDGATKVTLSENTASNVIKTAWEVGDRIIGWDASGKTLELEIASSNRITADGTAVFTKVSGNGTLPTVSGKKIYMIYAPGKTANDLGDGLTYSLASQSDKVPALMTATGTLNNGQIALNFTGVLALVAVKNPNLPVSSVTGVSGLKLSGSNVKSSVTINKSLALSSSGSGPITKSCSFTTAANGTTSGVMVYFAVAPNTAKAQVTVSTVEPTGYEIIKTDATFTAGNCYVLDTKNVTKQVFTISTPAVSNGSFSTNPSGSAAWDATVTITASPTNPDTDYELKPNSITVSKAGGGTVSYTGSGLSYTFTMPKDNVTVTGAFQKKKYTLTSSVNSTTMGSVAMKYTTGGAAITSGTAIEWGSGVTVAPTANTYYELEKITYGTTDITTAKKFDMPKADTEVSVTFRKCSYAISKAATSNGSFTVAESSQWGETVTVTATPDANYLVDKITVYKTGSESTTVTVGTDGSFTMPKYAVTVKVTFKPDTFAISKDSVTPAVTGASFKVTKNGGTSDLSEATPGDALKVEVTCPNGYKVDKITVYKTGDTSTTVEVKADGSFTMPAYAVTVKVELKLDESGSGTELTPGGLI